MGFGLQLPSAEETLKPSRESTFTAARNTTSFEDESLKNRFGHLSAEEQQEVDRFSKTIDLHQQNLSTNYALKTQSKMRELTSGALKGVSGKDIGGIEKLLANMSLAIKNFNNELDEEVNGKRGLFGFFNKAKSNIAISKERIQVRYKDVSETLDGIVNGLRRHGKELQEDSERLQGMYQENENYLKELTAYILAGKKALQDATNGELAKLRQIAENTGSPADAQAYQQFQKRCLRFEQRLYDLELTWQVCLQAAPQLELIRDSNDEILQQVISAINNSIPLWENGITIALALNRSERASKAVQTVRELTSDMLVNNAELLHTNSVGSAKLSVEGFVDTDAIKKCNQVLIQTLTDVSKIQAEGLQKRNKARMELGELNGGLMTAMLQPYASDNQSWIA